MEQYGSGYGDQIRRTDEYGNPVRHTGTGTGGPTGGSHVTPTGEHGARVFDHDKKEHGHGGGILHRSNSSSSSSSSEDDGQGGRKKKLKDKIKDKLPGGKKQHPTTTQDAYGHGTQDAYGHGTTATHGANTQDAYGHGTAATHGANTQDAYGHGTAATHGATTTQGPVAHGTAATHGATTTQGAYGHGAEEHEKKGIMDKIKEKLPGHH